MIIVQILVAVVVVITAIIMFAITMSVIIGLYLEAKKQCSRKYK